MLRQMGGQVIPLSKRAALFEPPPKMVEEAWDWLSRLYAGMCLGQLRPLGIATPARLADMRSALTMWINNLSRDIEGLNKAKDVVEEARLAKFLAPKYRRPMRFEWTKGGQVLSQNIDIDTDSSVWWSASSDGVPMGSGTPPKILSKVRTLLVKFRNNLQPADKADAAEASRLMNRLEQLSGGMEFPVQAYSQVFQTDISGWYHGRNIPEKWREYTLWVSPERNPKAVGTWSTHYRTLTCFLGQLLVPLPRSREKFENNRHYLRATLEHELVHLSQALLQALKTRNVEKIVDPGLLSRRMRAPKTYDIYGNLPGAGNLSEEEREASKEQYELREIEFEPNLRDEVKDFRLIASRTKPEWRRMMLWAWLLPPDQVAPKEKPQWPYMPTSWWPDIQNLVAGHSFFHILRRKEPGKWRAAAMKLIKSVADLL
jgi:hypothetical protein